MANRRMHLLLALSEGPQVARVTDRLTGVDSRYSTLSYEGLVGRF
jgi:hypothetical protein